MQGRSLETQQDVYKGKGREKAVLWLDVLQQQTEQAKGAKRKRGQLSPTDTSGDHPAKKTLPQGDLPGWKTLSPEPSESSEGSSASETEADQLKGKSTKRAGRTSKYPPLEVTSPGRTEYRQLPGETNADFARKLSNNGREVPESRVKLARQQGSPFLHVKNTSERYTNITPGATETREKYNADQSRRLEKKKQTNEDSDTQQEEKQRIRSKARKKAFNKHQEEEAGIFSLEVRKARPEIAKRSIDRIKSKGADGIVNERKFQELQATRKEKDQEKKEKKDQLRLKNQESMQKAANTASGYSLPSKWFSQPSGSGSNG